MRISPIAPPGSLLKSAERERRPKPAKKTRETDGRHVALIRRCPCLACDADPAGEAAHLRMTRAGKPIAGMGAKPRDRQVLPLCPACHTRGPEAQHRIGEPAFWSGLGLDPFTIAERLYAASPDLNAMRLVIFAARERRK